MKQLCIIPCGRKKVWDRFPDIGSAPACEAYIGVFHQLCRNYAKAFTDNWVVLSAKHGFLFADDIVDGNYDVTFNQKYSSIISMDRLREQVKEKKLDQYDELIVLAGKKYKKVVEGSFNKHIPISYPLSQFKGIGFMQQALKKAVLEGKPMHKGKQVPLK